MRAKTLIILVAALGLGIGGYALAQNRQHGMGQGMGHQSGQGMMGGMGMMRMLQGENIEPAEVDELRAMFMGHPAITRRVINLPDGIETVTESDDPALAEVIVSHVVGMIGRVEDNNDPKVVIQSPTLDILFENRDLITTVLEPTETGIKVIQTSADAATVAALQKHAAEVSAMAERGMRAVHEQRMAN